MQVGAVAGEKLEDDGGGGESMYWRFESWLKRREDRLGTTIGLIGELSAIRAEAWRPIPGDVAIDDLWAGLDIIEQDYPGGLRAGWGAGTSRGSLADQWERRDRNVSGALHVLVRRRRQLRPSAAVAAEPAGIAWHASPVSPLAHLALLALSANKMRSSVRPGRSSWPTCSPASDWWPGPGWRRLRRRTHRAARARVGCCWSRSPARGR